MVQAIVEWKRCGIEARCGIETCNRAFTKMVDTRVTCGETIILNICVKTRLQLKLPFSTNQWIVLENGQYLVESKGGLFVQGSVLANQ